MKKIIIFSTLTALLYGFSFKSETPLGTCGYRLEINSWQPFNGEYWSGGYNLLIDTVWYFNDIPAGDSVRIHFHISGIDYGCHPRAFALYKNGEFVDSLYYAPQQKEWGLKESGIYDFYCEFIPFTQGRSHFRLIVNIGNATGTEPVADNPMTSFLDAADYLQFQHLDGLGNSQLRLTDVSGRVLWSELLPDAVGDYTTHHSLYDMPAGIYFWQIISPEGKKYAGKVFKR